MKTEAFYDLMGKFTDIRLQIRDDEMVLIQREAIIQAVSKISDKITELVMADLTPKLAKLLGE
jgi:hypothetical protein